MRKFICTVHDSKAEVYLPPFHARARGEAIRIFSDLANNTDHQVGQYPEDFVLYHIGWYDDQTGALEPVPHESLGKASEFKSARRGGNEVKLA